MDSAGDKKLRDDTLILFDVDGTLTQSRQPMEQDMFNALEQLRKKFVVGLVGGSDLKKIAEQTIHPGYRGDSIQSCLANYDYVFAENGLVAFKNGTSIGRQSFLTFLGEEKLQLLINACLAHMSTLTLPVKRGNFIEFRNGLINVCPVGRSCSQAEREQFNAYDKEHKVREKFIQILESKFGDNSDNPLGLEFVIGGQISFDVFPRGWNKTFCLNLIDKSHKKIYFFGDQTHQGGNDYAIFADTRTIGHTVTGPEDTLRQLKLLNIL